MQLWPLAYPKKCTFDDVRFFMLLCQGQEAENKTDINIHVNTVCFGYCRTLLGSAEFARSVLAPLSLDKQTGHASFTSDQSLLIQKGLKRHFKVKSSAPKSWIEALRAAVSSHRFLKAFEAAKTGFSASWLEEKLAATTDKLTPIFTASIRNLTAGGVQGFAYDQAEPTRELTLDVYINDTFVGTCKTGGHSGDKQEETGTETQAEFQHTFQIPQQLCERQRLYISIYEHVSGALICPARELPIVDIRHSLLVEQLEKKLDDAINVYQTDDRIRDEIERIKKHLPDIEQFAAFPVSNFEAYSRCFKSPSAPTLQGLLPNVGIAKAPKYKYDPSADIVVFLDKDASLDENAIGWLQYCAIQNEEAAVFYGDYSSKSANGQIIPHYHGEMDRDLFYARPANVCAYAVKREKLDEAGGLDADNPHKHADLWLRLLERNPDNHFVKLPHMAWHVVQQKVPPVPLQMLSDHFDRLEQKISVVLHKDKYGEPVDGAAELGWSIDPILPRLAIIIPAKDAVSLTKGCVDSLRSTLQYPEHTEIIIIDNGSKEQETKDWLHWANGMDGIHVLLHDAPFNWAEMNNRAVESTKAEYLLFLNNDTVALDHGWDHILRGYLAREEIGLVGARLLFADGTIQYAGYILNEENIALKEAYCEPTNAGSYQERSQLPHATCAIIGAFMGCRRDVFDKAGGFDAATFPIAFNDIDFSLSVSKQGYKNLYVPSITFHHLESKTRGYDAVDPEKNNREQQERKLMRQKWQTELEDDPWYPSVFVKREPTHSLLAAPKKPAIRT